MVARLTLSRAAASDGVSQRSCTLAGRATGAPNCVGPDTTGEFISDPGANRSQWNQLDDSVSHRFPLGRNPPLPVRDQRTAVQLSGRCRAQDGRAVVVVMALDSGARLVPRTRSTSDPSMSTHIHISTAGNR